MTLSKSRVSICVATFNSSEYIADTLNSLLSQEHSDLQIVISDDASTDNTVELCKQFAEKDARIEVNAHQQRLGWIGNTNRALSYATGSFVMIMPHDDQALPGYLTSCLEALRANPEAVLAFSDACSKEVDGTTRIREYKQLEGINSPARRAVELVQRNGPWSVCYQGVFRSSALQRVGGLRYHNGGEFSADLIWILRFALLGEFVRVPETLFTKLYKSSSLSRTWSRSLKKKASLNLACARVIWDSELSFFSALTVYYAIARDLLRILADRFRQKLWRGWNWMRQIVYIR